MKETLANKEYMVENGIYTPIVKEGAFEESGGTYRMEILGEENPVEVLVPNIEPPAEPIDMNKLNRWGRARMTFLEEYRPLDFRKMELSGELLPHLLAIQEEVDEFEVTNLPKMKEAWGLREEMKNEDFLGYVGELNNLLSSMREMIFKEIIER